MFVPSSFLLSMFFFIGSTSTHLDTLGGVAPAQTDSSIWAGAWPLQACVERRINMTAGCTYGRDQTINLLVIGLAIRVQ